MELLLFSLLSCSDAKWIIDGIFDTSLTHLEQQALIIEIKQAAPPECNLQEYRRNWLRP